MWKRTHFPWERASPQLHLVSSESILRVVTHLKVDIQYMYQMMTDRLLNMCKNHLRFCLFVAKMAAVKTVSQGNTLCYNARGPNAEQRTGCHRVPPCLLGIGKLTHVEWQVGVGSRKSVQQGKQIQPGESESKVKAGNQNMHDGSTRRGEMTGDKRVAQTMRHRWNTSWWLQAEM